MCEPINAPTSELQARLAPAVESLNAGRIVCLTDGRRRALLANPTSDAPEDAIGSFQNGRPATFLVRDAAAALDFVENPSPPARRLMRNCWPGAVRLSFTQGVDRQLTRAFHQKVQDMAADVFGLSVPSATPLRELLNEVAYPLVKWSVAERFESEPASLLCLQSDEHAVSPEAEILIDGVRWQVVSEGGLTPAEIAQMTREHILFVCTGNTCRSPMAEGMCRRLLAERLGCNASELPERGFEIESAGLSAPQGFPASPESVDVCRACGVDLSRHSSQPVTESLLFKADRIYTMTAGHRAAIVSQYPELAEAVRLLSPEGFDVSDPIGWGPAAYQECHREITESLQTLVEEIASNH